MIPEQLKVAYQQLLGHWVNLKTVLALGGAGFVALQHQPPAGSGGPEHQGCAKLQSPDLQAP